MRPFFTYLLSLLLCITLGVIVSYLAFYSFWIGARWFHSVPVARVLDSVGSVLLFPARFVFYRGMGDHTAMLASPFIYVISNGTLLGILFYSIVRPFLVRKQRLPEK